MRIFGLMVTKNEADRYVAASLKWHLDLLHDGVFVFDDQSSDDTRTIARDAGATVVQRTDDIPSLLEHEGAFRQAAWRAFERVMEPDEGDWVLSIDADEFLVGVDQPILHLALQSEIRGFRGVVFNVVEVFDVVDGIPQRRTDGFWGTIEALRFFRYEPRGELPQRPLGCGSVPTYVEPIVKAEERSILHYGYAREADRQSKYRRYSAHAGHAVSHIESIVTPAELVPWKGPVPSHV